MTQDRPPSVAFVSERMLLGFGVDLVIHEVATRLQQSGCDVTVYASVCDNSLQRNYRLRTIPTRASGVPQRYQAAARYWGPYIDAFEHDVVFVESFPYYSLIPKLRTPAVVVDHGVSSTEGMSLKQRTAFRYIENSQHRNYFPRAAGIITVSGYIKSLLPAGLQDRARVIYNGADHYPPASRVEAQTMRARIGVRDDEVMMLYVGRLNPEAQPYKGTADLMELSRRWASEGRPIRVVMAGSGDAGDAARVEESGAIPLLAVPHEEMAALYAAADVYITASRWEGFDLPLAEAAVQGVPSVALNIGAHPEVVKNGETGILVDNIDELACEAAALAASPERRQAIGQAAAGWAREFTWDRAASQYLEVVRQFAPAPVLASVSSAGSGEGSTRQTTGPATATLEGAPETDVSVVILNYGAPIDVLRQCVSSAVNQTYKSHVILVDNGSPKNQDAPGIIQGEFPDVELLILDKNYGFAGGTNRGVERVQTEYVVPLNNDAVLAPNAIEEMRKVIEGREDVVGIAPKILLQSPEGYFDAIGNLVDSLGQAYNMGIGQLDIGQYDRVEQTFGACFAATLLRRNAWREGLVGPLDERFFMYYEDVDWCFRAGVLGYTFLTCPTATVTHAHSLSTRGLDYGYKYRMIMRNFARTVIKDFQGRRWVRMTIRRCLALARNVVRGPHRGASLGAIWDITTSLPHYVRERRSIQGRRKVDDGSLFNYSHGEPSFFDPTSYAPIRRLETLAFMYNRRYLLTGNEQDRRISEEASRLTGSRLRFDRERAYSLLAPLVADEPEYVRDYVKNLEV